MPHAPIKPVKAHYYYTDCIRTFQQLSCTPSRSPEKHIGTLEFAYYFLSPSRTHHTRPDETIMPAKGKNQDSKGKGKGKEKDASDSAESAAKGKGLKAANSINVRHILLRGLFSFILIAPLVFCCMDDIYYLKHQQLCGSNFIKCTA